MDPIEIDEAADQEVIMVPHDKSGQLERDESDGSSSSNNANVHVDANSADSKKMTNGSIANDNDIPHSAIIDKLNRELHLSKTHGLQLQSHWRQILSKEKYQELHNGVTQLSQYHDENISCKKDVIAYLEKEIHHLQELYQDAMVANMNRMEDLIVIHDEQVVKLERNFRNKVSSLQSQFHTDVEQIDTQYNQEKEVINEAMQCQADKDAAHMQDLRQEHQHELEEIKNRNLEHINSLRFIMDSRVEDLEEQFELTHGEFNQNTDGTQAAYDQLKSKEEAMRSEIESKARQANKLQREIQRFQLIARQEEARIQERHEELLARKSRAITRWNNTQEEMSKFRDEQQRSLVDMIRRANERKDTLGKQCALADRVKKIALACQKWESSREKFATLLRESSCPTETLTLTTGENRSEEEDDNSPKYDQEEHRSHIIGCMGQLGDTTHHFWNKYNMAKLDVLQLEKKVRLLVDREQDLKQKLKMYHDGITVNNDVMNDRNPLLVINGKMNAMPNQQNDKAGRRKTRRQSVVDGNHFFATNNLTLAA